MSISVRRILKLALYLLAAFGLVQLVPILLEGAGIVRPPAAVAFFRSPDGRYTIYLRSDSPGAANFESAAILGSGWRLFGTVAEVWARTGKIYAGKWTGSRRLMLYVSDDFSVAKVHRVEQIEIEFVRLSADPNKKR